MCEHDGPERTVREVETPEPPPTGLLDGGISPNQLNTFNGHLAAAKLDAEMAQAVLRKSYPRANDLVATAKRWTLEIPSLDDQVNRWGSFNRWLVQNHPNYVIPSDAFVALQAKMDEEYRQSSFALILCYGFSSDQVVGVDAKLSGELPWLYATSRGMCNNTESFSWDYTTVKLWSPARQMPGSQVVRPKGFYIVTLPPIEYSMGLGQRYLGESVEEVRNSLGSYLPMAHEGVQMLLTCPSYFQHMDGMHFPFLSLPGYEASERGGEFLRRVPCLRADRGLYVLELMDMQTKKQAIGPGVVKLVKLIDPIE